MSHSWIACFAVGGVVAVFVYLVYFFPKRVVAAAPWIADSPKWKGFLAMSSCLSAGSVLLTVALAELFSLGEQGMLESTPIKTLAVTQFFWSAPSAILYGGIFSISKKYYRMAIKFILISSAVTVFAFSFLNGDFSKWVAMIMQAVFGVLPLGSIATSSQKIVVGTPREIIFGQAAIPMSATVPFGVLALLAVWLRDKIAARKSDGPV